MTDEPNGAPRDGDASDEETRSFWTSLPGILTGLAGLLTAVVAVVGLFLPKAVDSSPDESAAGARPARIERNAGADHRTPTTSLAPSPTRETNVGAPKVPTASPTSDGNGGETRQPAPTPSRTPSATSHESDTCAEGYVWREAVEGDHVCVTTQAREDNAQAAERRKPPRAVAADLPVRISA